MKQAIKLNGQRAVDEVPLHHSIFNLYEPLSESDILTLQEKFLTPGFHLLFKSKECCHRT